MMVDRNNTQSQDNAQSQDTTDSGATVVVHVVPRPVIIDLGGRRSGAIRRLKDGRGKLMDEVADHIEHYRAGLPESERNKQVLPVIVIYKKKKKRRSLSSSSPFSLLSPFSWLPR
jgi:hypothetical protein